MPAFLLVASYAAAAPVVLSHQGRLFDADGTPLEGEHSVSVRLTDGDDAGAPILWSDAFTPTFRDGHFHMLIGSGAPLDGELFELAAVAVQVSVGGDAVSSPLPIRPVPYAVVAETARNVRGGVVEASEVWVDGEEVVVAGGVADLDEVNAERVTVEALSARSLRLGPAPGAGCDPATRGTLRYTTALEVCDGRTWAPVGGVAECFVVDGCGGAGPASRIHLGDVELTGSLGAELFCSRFDFVQGSVVTRFPDDTVRVPCLKGEVYRLEARGQFDQLSVVASDANVSGDSSAFQGLTTVGGRMRIQGAVKLPSLTAIDGRLDLTGLGVGYSLPSLERVGGGIEVQWGSEAQMPPVGVLFPKLTEVGGDFVAYGYRVPMHAPMLPSLPGGLSLVGPFSSVSFPALTSVAGTLSFDQDAGNTPPDFSALRTVGGLVIPWGYPGYLESFRGIERIDGPLTLLCIEGYTQAELEAFADAIGRENIAGPIRLVAWPGPGVCFPN